MNTAHRLAKMGFKVLVVDCDAQGNATSTLGAGKEPLSYPAAQTLSAIFSIEADTPSLSSLAIPTKTEGLSFIPNNLDIYSSITNLGESPRKFFGISRAYEMSPKDFDFILFDTPPSLEGVLLTNALIATDHVIIVVESESTYALSGIKNLIKAIVGLNREITHQTSILGYLLTKFDGRTNAAKTLKNAATELFGVERLFDTGIPNSTKVNQSIMKGEMICDFDPEGNICKAFKSFTQELLNRLDINKPGE
ncbi:ATPases involved in chromosome partitioning [Desulfovibrio sp. A2]|nr:ATPases involved in chromosome partitioning [Desulfovibrio sp. A2]